MTSSLACFALALSLGTGCGRDADGAKDAPDKKAKTDEHSHEHAEGEGHAEAEGADEHGHRHGEHTDEVKLTPDAIRNNGIRIGVAKKQVLTATLTAPARVAFNTEQVAHVGSAVIGRVKELKAKVGDAVKKGEVLLVIDSPELGEAQSEYLQRHALATVASEAIELSKSAYERSKKLYEETQGTSLNELEKRQAEYKAAAGNAATAKAAMNSARNKLLLHGMTAQEIESLQADGVMKPQYTVRSPLDGQLIEREVTLGELVSPDKEHLLTVADLTSVWVLVDVPEARLAEIADGFKVRIEVSAAGGESFEGVVAYIAPELDPSTRTARVRVAVPNPDKRLRPGMFARAQIAAGSPGREAVTAIGDNALQTFEGRPCVFVPVKDEPNTFAPRPVEVGPPANGMLPVLAGLKEGEHYVVSGAFILKAELGKAGAGHEH